MGNYAGKRLLFVAAMLFLGATNIGSSTTSSVIDESILKQLDYYKQEAECGRQEALALNKVENKKKYKVSKSSKYTGKFKTIGKFKTYSYTNTDIQTRLFDALQHIPIDIFVTSALRPHSHGSLHKKGLAVDIKWNEEGKEFIKWLDSDQGKTWLDTYSLDFYLENLRDYKSHPNYLYNPRATGPHIHVYVKN